MNNTKDHTEMMELDTEELEQVNGGGLCVAYGIGFDGVACWFGKGVSLWDLMPEDQEHDGTGATLCMGIGVGLGICK